MVNRLSGRRDRRAALAAAATLALCTVLGACADRPTDAPDGAPIGAPAGVASAAAPGPPVIVPGGPGEPARTVSPQEAAQLRPPQQVSPADVTFVSMMIPHHEQALLMSGLAPTRAVDPGVRAIAERIAASQEPEIAVMESWVARHAPEHAGGHGDHHAGMDGMASPTQLDALAAASGAEFDRMFLDLMIVHHEGAVAMAHREQIGGTDTEAQQLADHVVSSQSAEIARMQALAR